MIILRHLTVDRFRLLREVNLHFPQRGSILIQGPNEAGKSTLFESIYFALYGEPIMSEPGKASHLALDDLILYGERQATVSLTLSVGATELMIMRQIERGKGQKVTLQVRRLGMPQEETITRLNAANERIIAELGRLDGETLRNSCLVEQKGLNRLENLSGSEREATLRKLLGLEKLMSLSEQFTATPRDEQLLNDSVEQLKLAEMQARIPELSMQLGQIEAALDAITISEDLTEISQQEAEIAEQELSLEELQKKRAELKGRQVRAQQLKKASEVLGEIIAAYDAMAEARRELPLLEQQIAELDRREREELPALEKRVRELGDLSRSFGTLERMAADLLTAVNTIKELEQELKQPKASPDELEELDQQIASARSQLEQVQQAQRDLEEQNRSGRPQLEARLQRLRALSEQLAAFRQRTEQYAQQVMSQGLSEENAAQLKKVQKELQETEQELTLVENEARQAQQQADALEKRWRQLSIARQIEEWQRLKGLSRSLTDAEQHVMAAHQKQEQLTMTSIAVRRTATRQLGMAIVCLVLTVFSGSFAIVNALQRAYVVATIAGFLALALAAGVAFCWYNYSKTRQKVEIADHLAQEAVNQVSMMVAAREAAMRVGGSHEAVAQIEHEIRSLGGSVPRSVDEARYLLDQIPNRDESLADIQKKMTELRNSAVASRNQVNVTMEAVARLRKERAHLEEQRQKEDQDRSESTLRSEQAALEQMRQEIISRFSREGLSAPNLQAADSAATLKNTEAETVLQDAIKATEQEMAVLDGKLTALPDVKARLKTQQEALNALLTRRQAAVERRAHSQTSSPSQQIERARQQQIALRDALRNLQDSLRQRVKPLGVSFGQAAISSAESVARKQLEELHITLGRRVELESRRAAYTVTLKERQESLSEHYQRLAKYSSSLGSWVVPTNPFTETLVSLRNRCLRELQEANENDIVRELEEMQIWEGASKAKIELCQQEIEEAHDRIATMLMQRSRPTPKSYTFTDIVAVWPLVGEYSSQDRSRLEEESQALEQELSELELQELELSTKLLTGNSKLDLEQARKRMEQYERNYQTKKRGSLLVKAVSERLMRKMLPRTEYYMQQLLPLLTSSRYHDVRLRTDSEEGTASGGPFQLRAWDSAANDYVSKSVLSGGTADQFSLVLRLAFAIAALPRELGAAPGFMLLDEPLSAFDSKRAQALVDVVTGELLGEHFEQVMFISHSGSFDPALFPYHLYLEGGMVVESNLPVAPPLPLLGAGGNGKSKEKDVVEVTVSTVPASVQEEASVPAQS